MTHQRLRRGLAFRSAGGPARGARGNHHQLGAARRRRREPGGRRRRGGADVRAPPELWSSTTRTAGPHAARRGFPAYAVGGLPGRAANRGEAIVAVGLLLLILTPVARVAVSILAFLYQRDRVFTLITLAVLIILLMSFVIGRWRGGATEDRTIPRLASTPPSHRPRSRARRTRLTAGRLAPPGLCV